MKSRKPLLLQRTATTFIDLYQSVRKAAKFVGIDHAQLHRMSKGLIKDAPPKTLEKLGLEHIPEVEIHRSKK